MFIALGRRGGLAPVLVLVVATLGLVGLAIAALRYTAGPRPDARSAPPLPALPMSVIEIPVTYDPDAIAAEIEGRTPARIGDLDLRLRYAGDPSLSYSYEAVRGPVEVRAVGDTIHLSSIVRYGGRAWYRPPGGPELSAGCGVENGEVRLAAAIELSAVLDVASNWAPRAQVEVSRVEPLGASDRCVVGLFAFQADVTETIMDEVRRALELDARAIEEAVAAVPLPEIARRAWRSLGEPLPIAQGGWLVLSPVAASLEPVSSTTTGAVRSTILLAARPVWTATEPPAVPATDPPDAAPPEGTPSPSVELDAVLPLEFLGPEIERLLAAGGSVSFLGRNFRISSVDLDVGDRPGRIRAEMELAEVDGLVVRVEGAPYLDGEAGLVGIEGIALSFEGLGPFTGAAARLLRRVVERRLESAARLPVGDLVTGLPGMGTSVRVDVADGIELVGSFDDAEIVAVGVTDGDLVLRIRATPRPMLSVRF